jgi:hypothetical protein
MNKENLDVTFINDKTRNLENTYDLISELFGNYLFNEEEERTKYFIFSTFLLNNIKFPFQEIWRLLKIILSINPNITREKTESNKYFGNCVKLCVKLFHKSITNLNLDKNLGFKCKEVPAIFDFLFSFPLIKHFINLIENEEQKNEINEILREAIKIIDGKIKMGKNNVMKNVYSNFYHFLDINENDIVIPNNNIKINSSIFESNKKEKESNIVRININNLNDSVNNDNNKISSITNNSSLIKPKGKKESPPPKNNPVKKEIYQTDIKNKINVNATNDEPSNNKVNKTIKNNLMGKYLSPENRKNVNNEIKAFRKHVKGIINKVNNFINFEEMKKAIKTKLPSNYLMQIGSFLYMTPFPDLSNINIDLLISRQNNNTYYIKKYFDTFEAFKNIPNVKCSFFCLNKDQYFYDCLEKNKSFFHLTRTDIDDDEALSTYSFKTVTVHLYAYNMIYGYSSFFIKKLYSTLKNVGKLHLFFERILLQELPILKSNYEISILILNFLQSNYKIFSEKCEDKKFTYFAYDKSKNYGFLTNFPLLMQYKNLFFFEFDDQRLNTIKQKNVIDLVKEFHLFICKYFEYIFYDGKKYDIKRADLNVFREHYFLDSKYIFNRIFLDNNLISYKNNVLDEFQKIQNLFNALTFE